MLKAHTQQCWTRLLGFLIYGVASEFRRGVLGTFFDDERAVSHSIPFFSPTQSSRRRQLVFT